MGASLNQGGGVALWISIPEDIEVLIAQENIQGEETAQTGGFPELAGALKAVLQLAAEGFNGAATNRASLAGDLSIMDMLTVGLKILHLRAHGGLGFLGQGGARIEQCLQRSDDFLFLAVMQLVQKRFGPGAGLRGALAMHGMSDCPEMLAGVMKIQDMDGGAETLLR
jgi:hypothetical protein